jgi:hypothetical protein
MLGLLAKGVGYAAVGAGRLGGRLALGGAKMAGRLPGLAKGPVGLGLTALLPGKWGGLKYAIPAVGLGLYGLGKVGYGLVGGAYSPYSMESENVNYDGRVNRFGPGTYAPYTNTPMQFGTFRRSYLDYNATGSLAFALHNRR